MTIKEQIGSHFLIPVVVIDDAQRALDTARALQAGGVDTMEITLRTEAALKAIENAKKADSSLIVGAGTVLTLEKCKEAVSRGASFIVSPGYNHEIVEYCLKNDTPVFPGCVTPTEITAAINIGLHVVKFFPANVYGGVSGIKALAAAFSGLKFIPTGGINNENLAQFVIPEVFAIGGGWLCERKLIAGGDYAAITAACVKAKEIVKQISR